MKTLDPCTIILSMAELSSFISNVCFFVAMRFVSLHLIIRDLDKFGKFSVPLCKLSQISLTTRAPQPKTQESLHTPTRYLAHLPFFKHLENIGIFIVISEKYSVTIRKHRKSVVNWYNMIPKTPAEPSESCGDTLN